jgi:hypothetical protein
MTMRFAPPGLTSSATPEIVQGRGTNHCFISFGSVQARYTFSRGASKIRSRTSSRSLGKSASIFARTFIIPS